MIWKTTYQSIRSYRYEYIIYFTSFIISTKFIYAYIILMDKKFWIDMGFSVAFSALSDKILFAAPFVFAIPTMLVIYAEYFLYMRKKKEFAIRILSGFTRQKITYLYCIEKTMIALWGAGIGILMGGLFSPLILSKLVAYMGERLYYSPLFSVVTTLRVCGYIIGIFIILSLYYSMRIKKGILADLLKDNKSGENYAFKKKGCSILRVGYLLFGYICILISFLLVVFFYNFMLWQKIIGLICVLIPILAIRLFIKNKKKYQNSITVIVLGIIEEILLCILYPVLYSMVKAKLLNIQLLYLLVIGLIVMLFYIIFYFYEILSDLLTQKRIVYKKNYSENRIVLGDICYNVQIYSRVMAAISVAMIFVVCMGIWLPICMNRIEGYLYERSVYDMQLFTVASYNKYIENENKGVLNFDAALDQLKEEGIEIDKEVIMEIFFVDEYMENGDIRPATCVSLSAYNKMLASLGIQPISLEDEYAIQWSKNYSQEQMDTALDGILKIKVGENEFYNTSVKNYMYKTKMALFTAHMDYIYIFQDSYCRNLTQATSIALYNFATNINYEESLDLETKINNLYKSSDDKVYVRLKTLQRVEAMSVITLGRIVGEYVGILLFLGCLVILSVQLLINILQSEKKYFILLSLGFTVKKIKILTFRNEMVWFLTPMVSSGIIAMGCILFSFLFFLDGFLFYTTPKQVLLCVVDIYCRIVFFSSMYIVATSMIIKKIVHTKINTFKYGARNFVR